MGTREPVNEQPPKWEFGIPLDTFKWVLEHSIKRIEHGHEMTSADTSREWLVLVYADYFQTTEERIEVPIGFLSNGLFAFAPDGARLLNLTFSGKRARERLDEIRAFEKRHKRELAALKRLKAKYEQE